MTFFFFPSLVSASFLPFYFYLFIFFSNFKFTENKKMPSYGSVSSALRFSVLSKVTGLQIRFWWTTGRAASQTRWCGDTLLGHEAEETVSGAWHACEIRNAWNETLEHQAARGGALLIESAWFLRHSVFRLKIYWYVVFFFCE